VAMAASDGAFDSVQEAVVATLTAFAEPAVNVVCVRGLDAMQNKEGPGECIYLSVYDPATGFVTGGGWFVSPSGAVPTSGLTGKASFGFVSKYLKGAKVPTGQTQFDFQVADLNFHSSTYDWLVVAGARAQYKGTGTVRRRSAEVPSSSTPSNLRGVWRGRSWRRGGPLRSCRPMRPAPRPLAALPQAAGRNRTAPASEHRGRRFNNASRWAEAT